MDGARELEEALEALVALLVRDPHCRWRGHFEEALDACRGLGPEPEARRAVADFVLKVFGGLGSFNDYLPVFRNEQGGYEPIPGMEGLHEASERVHEAARALRRGAS